MLAERRLVALLMLACVGCTSLSGLADLSFDAQASATGGGVGGIANSGGGGAAGEGGVLSAGGANSAGGGGDGGACTGELPCFTSPSVEQTVTCNEGQRLPACLPDTWSYCDCGAGGGPAVFFEPASGTGPLERVTLLAAAGNAPFALELGGLCVGAVTLPDCRASACDPGLSVFVWTDLAPFSNSSGVHPFDIWHQDDGPPCAVDGGGAVIITALYEIP